jgi:hypothetical protein
VIIIRYKWKTYVPVHPIQLVFRLLSLSSPSFKMFVLEAETKLFVNRLSALSCNDVTNMLKVLYRHVKETVQQSPRISLEFTEFLVTVKHVCKIMLKVEIAAHAFKETHQENCLYYNIHGEINVFLPKCFSVECEYIFFHSVVRGLGCCLFLLSICFESISLWLVSKCKLAVILCSVTIIYPFYFIFIYFIIC